MAGEEIVSKKAPHQSRKVAEEEQKSKLEKEERKDEDEENTSNSASTSQDYDEDDDYSDVDEAVSWVEWFCGTKGNEFFVEVDEDFIRDDFNLTGLSSCIPQYERALDEILDNETEDEEELNDGMLTQIDCAANFLYGLIHSRFILTNRGLELMHKKYIYGIFGVCANTYCNEQNVLPIGLLDTPNKSFAKIFCPKCNEVLHPPKTSRLGYIDGAFFGTTFPHMYFLHYQSEVPRPLRDYYTPRIYGYKVHTNVKDILRRELANFSRKSSSTSSCCSSSMSVLSSNLSKRKHFSNNSFSATSPSSNIFSSSISTSSVLTLKDVLFSSCVNNLKQ